MKNKYFIISLLTWLTYALLFSVYQTYYEVTNEGGFDSPSIFNWFFGMLIISLPSSPIMIGFLFLFFKFINNHPITINLKKLIAVIGIIFIQIISSFIGPFIFYSMKHKRFNNLFDELLSYFSRLFSYIQYNYPILLVYILVSIVFTSILFRQRNVEKLG